MGVGGGLKSVVGEGVGKGAEEGVYGCMGRYREVLWADLQKKTWNQISTINMCILTATNLQKKACSKNTNK